MQVAERKCREKQTVRRGYLDEPPLFSVAVVFELHVVQLTLALPCGLGGEMDKKQNSEHTPMNGKKTGEGFKSK